MSLLGAMIAGVSGLSAQSQFLGMISDNIANVSTVGFKGTNAQFSTLVTGAATKTSFSPGGVQTNVNQLIDRQGLIQSTSSPTDVSILGQGFFVINEAAVPGTGDEFFYTRAGSFAADVSGFLRNTAGFYLMGWPTDSSGVPTPPSLSTLTSLESINVSGISGNAVATTSMSIGANLPATKAINGTESTSVQIFDSLGVPHNLILTYTKTAANTWDVTVRTPTTDTLTTLTNVGGQVVAAAGRLDFTAQPADGDVLVIDGVSYEFDNNASVTDAAGVLRGVTIGSTLASTVGDVVANWLLENGGDTRLVQGTGTENGSLFFTQSAAGGAIAFDATNTANITQSSAGAFTVPATAATPTITFNGDGTPATFGVTTANLTHTNGANASAVTIDFGTAGLADGLTQYANAFTTYFIQQNGVRFGTFSAVSINDQGLVSALFDNGQTLPIFKIPLATFSNPKGLDARTGNVFRESDISGTVLLNQAGTNSAGSVAPSSLEASNIDIATEFTNMIVAQRAFTAAARAITVADEMLEEVTRIAR